jgi:hypothetical protein
LIQAKSDSILANLDADHAKVFNDCLLEPIRAHANPMKRRETSQAKQSCQMPLRRHHHAKQYKAGRCCKRESPILKMQNQISGKG